MKVRSAFPAGILAIAGVLGGCAARTTQLGTAPADALRAEQLTQQQLAIEYDIRLQRRVDDVGHALLAAASPFCGDALAPRAGVRFANVHSFARDHQPAARVLGFSDTLVVVGVARGSAAARAGFTIGDRVIALDDGPPPRGASATELLARSLAARRLSPSTLTLQQGHMWSVADTTPSPDRPAPTGQLRTTVPADTVCGYNLVAASEDELDAWADDSNVVVTSAMLRFVADDDELAAMLAHEIAHNVMRHAQGVNVGSMVFSQDFEREADYLAMYLLARAGRSTAKAPSLWRRLAQEDPASVKYASSHPTTAERFTRLEQVSSEIEQKIARREALRPELRIAPASTVAQAPVASSPAASKVESPPTLANVDRGFAQMVLPSASLRRSMLESQGEVVSGAARTYSTTLAMSDSVSYTFGPAAPRNGLTIAQAQRRALQAFQDGNEALELRLYELAEQRYRDAVLHDGGEARYHAALGALLLKRGKRAAAEAALSAAVLLDVESAVYRRLLLEARQSP